MNLYRLKLSEMIDGMKAGECPFCFIDALFYKWYFKRLIEGVLDEDYKEEWTKGGGFCPEHTKMLLKQGSATGHAILYQYLLEDWKERWTQGDFDCPVCAKIAKDLADSKKVFAWGLKNDAECLEEYKKSSGICRGHFVSVYGELDEDLKKLVVEVQERAFERLKENLELLLRQHDYNYDGPKNAESLRSWKKAARYYIGGLDKQYKAR